MKVYAVRKGYKTGIFDSWAECQEATKGFPKPEFKSFKTREEAEAYLEERDVWVERVAKDSAEGFLVAFTDGSFDQKLNMYSYGVFFVLPNGEDANVCGYGSNPEYIDSRNIIGEVLGVIHALDWAMSNGFEKIRIYHDYEGLSKWISGEWSAKSKVALMYTKIYELKFKDFLQVEFIKVPGHSNVVFNEKADSLARMALEDKKKVVVQGGSWFIVPYFPQDVFENLVQNVVEVHERITHTTNNNGDKVICKFTMGTDTATLTLFKTGKRKLLVQGKNSYLFQIVVAMIVELHEVRVGEILKSTYRTNIDEKVISDSYNTIISKLPADYPEAIKRLLKQSLINLECQVKSEDYSMYVFPVFKALEGHIRYLIKSVGGEVEKTFNCFKFDFDTRNYVVAQRFADPSKNSIIEKCYNYYKSNRDTLFHYGYEMNIENTRFIDDKEEVDELIKECLDLIIEQ